MEIKVDVDGVLRDVITELVKIHSRKYNSNLKVDDVVDYHICKYIPHINNCRDFFEEYNEQIFLHAKPYPNTINIINKLYEQGHTIKIVSAQFPFAEDLTTEWLKKYKVQYHELHYTSKKERIQGDLFIDDHYEYIMKSKDKYPLLVSRPWNMHYNYNHRINSLKEVYDYLKDKTIKEGFYMSKTITGRFDNDDDNITKTDLKVALKIVGDAYKPLILKLNNPELLMCDIYHGTITMHDGKTITGLCIVKNKISKACITPDKIYYDELSTNSFIKGVHNLAKEVGKVAKMLHYYHQVDKRIYEKGEIEKRQISISLNKNNKLELVSRITV